jgi:hypothetical protein
LGKNFFIDEAIEKTENKFSCTDEAIEKTENKFSCTDEVIKPAPIWEFL